MTPKERWYNTLECKPVDRMMFWPKLHLDYPLSRDKPFSTMDLEQIHSWIGSDQHIWIKSIIKEPWDSTTIDLNNGRKLRRTVFRSRFGDTELVEEFDRPSHSWHPTETPIRDRKDIQIIRECFKHYQPQLDEKALEEARAICERVGDDGITATEIATSPFMQFVEYFAGIERAHILLFDYEQEVQELFNTLHEANKQIVQTNCQHNPADILYMTENTSTTLHSPEQFRKYCAGFLRDYENIAEDHGRIMLHHMCGHLYDLLPDLSQLHARGFEAFSSPPVGNTSLVDGRTRMPNKCLIGGTNAVLWGKEEKEIIAELERDLDALAHHRGLVITSGGVMPPSTPPSKIKNICQWVHRYNVRM
jgi:uroporphyrinogen-III decarboxylase